MANTWTDYGVSRMLDITFRGATAGTAAKVVLLSTIPANPADLEQWSPVSSNEVAAGNGYSTGGQTVNMDATGFDVLADDAGNNRQYLQLADVSWTAVGGTISSVGAALVITDGGTEYVYAIFDFGSTVAVADGSTVALVDCELRVAVS